MLKVTIEHSLNELSSGRSRILRISAIIDQVATNFSLRNINSIKLLELIFILQICFSD